MEVLIYIIIGIFVSTFAFGLLNKHAWDAGGDLILSILIGIFWIFVIPLILICGSLWYPIKYIYKLGKKVQNKLNLF